MDSHTIVRAAIPGATDELCSHILWGRTPFPCGAITVRSLYRAASAWRRAGEHGIQLCDLCHRKTDGGWTCARCAAALARCNDEEAA